MKEAPITNVHRAITQEDIWLNTARPLVAEDLRGRIILLDFWTFCCINCMHIIPDLQALEAEFGEKLTVIGVHSAKFANERDTENIRQAMLRYDIEHPVVNDAAFHIWQSFGVRAWPTLVLINPLGQLEEIYSGEGHKEELRYDIDKLLKKYGNTLNTAPLPLAPEKKKTPETLLKYPGKLAYAPDSAEGEVLFIADSGRHQIVAATLEGKTLFRIGAGTQGNRDGSFTEAQFNTPQGLLYHDNRLYVADTENHLLRQVDLKTKKVSTLAGTGVQGFERRVQDAPALKTPLASPWDVAFYPDTSQIIIAMAGTHQLWSYDTKRRSVSVVAGNGAESIDDGRYPYNSLSQPSGLSAHDGNLYFVDSETSSLRVYDGHKITTLIGTGLFDFGYKEGKQGVALMQHPLGVFADGTGVYVADSYNHSLRRYDVKKETLSHYAGHGKRGMKDGALVKASFNEPNAIIAIKGKFYIADTNNHAIRILDPEAGNISTLNLMPEDAAPDFRFTEGLPNIRPLADANLAFGAGASLQFQLPGGWKFNDGAPSWLALYEKNGKDMRLVKGYALPELKAKTVALPALEKGKTYHLQGTFYYCQDALDSVCLIQSLDALLQESADSADTTVVVDFLMPID